MSDGSRRYGGLRAASNQNNAYRKQQRRPFVKTHHHHRKRRKVQSIFRLTRRLIRTIGKNRNLVRGECVLDAFIFLFHTAVTYTTTLTLHNNSAWNCYCDTGRTQKFKFVDKASLYRRTFSIRMIDNQLGARGRN